MVQTATPIKAIIWDLDGTIIDSFKIYKAVLLTVSKQRHLKMPSDEMIINNYHGGLSESIHAAFDNQLSPQELDEFIEDFLHHQSDYYLDLEEHLLQDAIELSKRATKLGIRQLLVTNRDHVGRGHGSPRAIVANSVLKDHIQEVICGDDVKVRKPDPQAAEAVLKRWKIKPHEVLVIGDQHVDAQLAMNLGARGVIVTRGANNVVHTQLLDPDWENHVIMVTTLDEVIL